MRRPQKSYTDQHCPICYACTVRDEETRMKIKRIKGHAVSVPLGTPHCNATSGVEAASGIVVEGETDDGLIGYGTVHGRQSGLAYTARAVQLNKPGRAADGA